MSTVADSVDLESSDPVELDQLQFDLHGSLSEEEDDFPKDSENIPSERDNPEPSVLSSLIPDTNNSSTSEGLLSDNNDRLENQGDSIVQQSQGVSLPDVVTDILTINGCGKDTVLIDMSNTNTETSGDGQIETSGHGQIETSGDGQIEMSGDGQIETSGDGQIETSGDGLIETSGDGQIETSGDGLIETSGDGLIETSGDGQIETSGDGLIETSGDGQIETSGDGQIETSGDGLIEMSGDGQIDGGRKKQYEVSPGTQEAQISLKESVRSLQDVIIESGPVPENMCPVDLLQEKTVDKDADTSDSEFEEEYAEQEVIQKSDSESDSEFQVPDRPQQPSQTKTVSFEVSHQENASKVISDKSDFPKPSEISSKQTCQTTQLSAPGGDPSAIMPSIKSDIPSPPQPSTQSPSKAGHHLASIPSLKVSAGLPSLSVSGFTGSPGQPPEAVNIPSQTPQRAPEVQTSDDWDNVTTIQAEFAENKEKSSGNTANPANSTPLLSVSEAVEHFRQSDLSAVRPNVRVCVDRHGLSALAHFLFGPPKLHRDLQSERELVFLIAGSQLNNEESTHIQILQSIYRILTGSRFDCQRFGSHWEEIGFQGRDPGTDIRGVGMLGLIQLLFFLRNPKSAQLARDVYKLSLHPTQNFPFCVMGINVSRICLQSLREDLVNKECNKRRLVMDVVNEFYVGVYLHLYRIWRQGKTITDSGHVLKEVETFAKKNTKSVFKNLEDYLKQKPSHPGDVTVEDGQEEFLSVCKADPDE